MITHSFKGVIYVPFSTNQFAIDPPLERVNLISIPSGNVLCLRSIKEDLLIHNAVVWNQEIVQTYIKQFNRRKG